VRLLAEEEEVVEEEEEDQERECLLGCCRGSIVDKRQLEVVAIELVVVVVDPVGTNRWLSLLAVAMALARLPIFLFLFSPPFLSFIPSFLVCCCQVHWSGWHTCRRVGHLIQVWWSSGFLVKCKCSRSGRSETV